MHRLASDRLVLMRPPNSADAVIAAGRFTHAFLDGATTTLCGTALERLHWRELADELWEDLSPLLRCRACEREIGT